jgi:protein-L-isoaspartate(D-aspartate) O-methyltransferase
LQLRPPILPETVRSLAFSALVPQTPPRLSPPPGEDSMIDFARARRTMVDTQVRTNDVTDARILDALLDVPREIFVPEQLKPIAYLDHDIPVGPAHAGRHIMQPMVFAKLLQAAAIERSDRVLDVGCATGYSAAVISLIAGSVVALESKEELLATCRKMLEGARNIELAHGDLVAGYPAGGPYDVILLEGAVEVVPEALFGQLAERGRLVAIKGYGRTGRATVHLKISGDVSGRVAFDTAARPLKGFEKPPAFAF